MFGAISGRATRSIPLGSVKAGELLIKRTYEALRKSPIWASSMLVIIYDEHGGFYDHVAPPLDTSNRIQGAAITDSCSIGSAPGFPR